MAKIFDVEPLLVDNQPVLGSLWYDEDAFDDFYILAAYPNPKVDDSGEDWFVAVNLVSGKYRCITKTSEHAVKGLTKFSGLVTLEQ
jgi:hypothetical protein